ncbi:hypothetical protein JCM13591A_31330 [Microbacterium xylanilyticum]
MRRALPWLLVYAVALILIAFWPQHVDRGMGSVLHRVTSVLPVLTYTRIEFCANVLLLVPVGILLRILITRRRYLVVAIGFFVSGVIETVQGLFLPGRTASVSDLVANTVGACIGLLIVEAVTVISRERARRR